LLRCYVCFSSGTLDAIIKMIRFEGLTGFYKGMSTKIVQSVVAAAILFMIKEELVKAARALVTKQVKLPKVVSVKTLS
jgi:adenine nucleotide transporter 17